MSNSKEEEKKIYFRNHNPENLQAAQFISTLLRAILWLDSTYPLMALNLSFISRLEVVQ